MKELSLETLAGKYEDFGECLDSLLETLQEAHMDFMDAMDDIRMEAADLKLEAGGYGRILGNLTGSSHPPRILSDRWKKKQFFPDGSSPQTFTCCFLPKEDMEPWQGTLCQLQPFEPWDFEVCARGSMFHVILGHHSSSYYLCIPDRKIGMDIAEPDDCFWNYEHLTAAYPKLNRIDAISIVNAAAAIKHYNG